jgi:hypothetical protein
MEEFNVQNIITPHVRIEWKMLNSEAYKALPASAAKALPYFLGKVKRGFDDPARYTTEFSFNYGEARRFGFAPATYSRVIRDLVKHGFIDLVCRGGFSGGQRIKSTFRLSERWRAHESEVGSDATGLSNGQGAKDTANPKAPRSLLDLVMGNFEDAKASKIELPSESEKGKQPVHPLYRGNFQN